MLPMKLLDVRIFCPVSLSCLFVVMSLKHPHETIRLHERECRHGSILLLHGLVKSTAKQLKEYCIHELRQLRQGSYSTAPPRSKIKYIVRNISTQMKSRPFQIVSMMLQMLQASPSFPEMNDTSPLPIHVCITWTAMLSSSSSSHLQAAVFPRPLQIQ